MSVFMAFNLFSQSDNLRVSIYHEIYDEDPCFQLTICDEGDTIYSQTISNEDEVSIDSLELGFYSVNLTNCGSESDEVLQSITKNVEIKSLQIATLHFDFSQYVNYIEVDPINSMDIIRSRTELQVDVSYFDFRWNPDGNNPKFNLGIGYSGYQWNSFSKHVGFLIGGGAGFMFAPLRVDSTTNIIDQQEVKSSYYSYINGQFDVKFRFSSLNQQRATIKAHSVFIDIGALYNLPLYFKKVTRFNFHDKIVNSFIHQYTDVRFYANVGFTNVQLFLSYRPFDFIRGNFQEIPRWNTGIKINVNY